jgi:hypothetical protein
MLQYETNSDDIRRQFEEFGEIKTFFDIIATRGMVFVTYVSGAHTNEMCDLLNVECRTTSMICVQLSEQETVYKDQKSAVDL